MSMTKEQARFLKGIANHWCSHVPGYKPPARWTPQEVSRLCDLACAEYAAGEGLFIPLMKDDRKLEARRSALLKELRQVKEALDALKKVRDPHPETREAMEATERATQSITGERQRLDDLKTFEKLHQRPKKKGRGRSAAEQGQLILDLAAALRCGDGATPRKHIAHTIHETLRRHSIPSTSVENVEQALRNAQLKNSKNRIS